MELPLVIFAVICMVASLGLARLGMGRTWAFSPLMLFVIMSILFINSGFVVFYLEASSEPWAGTALLSVSIGLLMVALGGWVGSSLFKVQQVWANRPRVQVSSDISYNMALLCAFVVFFFVMLYFAFLGYVPLISGIYMLLTEGFTAGLVNTLRISEDPYINPDAAYIPLRGLFESMRYFGLPIIAIWFLDFRRKRIRPGLSLAMLITAIAMITFTGQRWPLMYLLLGILTYLSWVEPQPRKYRKLITRIFVVAFALGVVLSALLGRTEAEGLSFAQMLSFGFGDLLKRIVIGQVKAPFLGYSLFPGKESWLFGWSYVQNMISFLPGRYESFSVTFNMMVIGDGGFTGPPDFYTEAFINFWWPGVIVLSFLWGLALAYFQGVILAANRITTLGYCCLLTTLIAFSPFSGVTFIFGGVIIIVFLKLTMVVLQMLGVARFPKQARMRIRRA